MSATNIDPEERNYHEELKKEIQEQFKIGIYPDLADYIILACFIIFIVTLMVISAY